MRQDDSWQADYHGMTPGLRVSLRQPAYQAGALPSPEGRGESAFLAPVVGLERGTGFEPATTCLEGRGSTAAHSARCLRILLRQARSYALPVPRRPPVRPETRPRCPTFLIRSRG